MLRKAIACASGVLRPWHTIALRKSSVSSSSISTAINSILLRSLKDHYLGVTKMNPPPKVSPPSPFSVVSGSLDKGGPVLKRTHGNEEISISVMRLTNIVPGGEDGGGDDDDDDDGINQLFLHVDISKPGQKDHLHFLCGLYPDALGIHSVSMRQKTESSGFLVVPSKYNGPVFEHVDERMRDAFHGYIEERGINHSLFPFLQAWLYVKDHRHLLRWFKFVGAFIRGSKQEG